MTGFISCAEEIKKVLPLIIACETKHAKWLNTLSYLENCGARKIAACEHPTLVKEEMLKHAAEEFRHAHYLKRQIERISPTPIEDYAQHSLLGGMASVHYLTLLNVQTCRYLSQTIKRSASETKEAAYLLVTYAIELRAEELYPLYEEMLRKEKLRVTVKSILLEEKEHLNEMRDGLTKLQWGMSSAEKICTLEGILCKKWLNAVSKQVV